MKKKENCIDCVWVKTFKPRKDEIERKLLLGCGRSNCEGYTHENNPVCGGVFFSKKERKEVKKESQVWE